MARSFAVILFLVLTAITTAVAQPSDSEAVTIPLDRIWGYNLPGTKDVVGIPFPEQKEGIGQTFAQQSREREYNIEQIRRTLASKPPAEKASAGFVLPRQPDSLILRGVYPPLRGKPNPLQRTFPEGEFTLVFFSHPLSYYARLRKVERDGNEFTVQYQFEPHTTPESTVHFALIPLGKLSVGEYRVIYKQIPIDDTYREAGFEPVMSAANQIICRDFSFKIGDESEPTGQDGTSIPLREVWGYDMPKTRDAKELDAVKSVGGTAHPIIDSLTRLVFDRFRKREKAGPAFVVEGTGKTALENMVKALQDEPAGYVSSNTDISLVFYTRFSGYFVHVESVERFGEKVVVTYRFVQHASRNVTFHFALIPLGEMLPGTYEVEINQSPPIDDAGRPMTLDQDLTWTVCHDAMFTVEGR